MLLILCHYLVLLAVGWTFWLYGWFQLTLALEALILHMFRVPEHIQGGNVGRCKGA